MTSEEDHADSFLCEENENALLEWLKFFNEDATDIMKDEVGETLSIIFSDSYPDIAEQETSEPLDYFGDIIYRVENNPQTFDFLDIPSIPTIDDNSSDDEKKLRVLRVAQIVLAASVNSDDEDVKEEHIEIMQKKMAEEQQSIMMDIIQNVLRFDEEADDEDNQSSMTPEKGKQSRVSERLSRLSSAKKPNSNSEANHFNDNELKAEEEHWKSPVDDNESDDEDNVDIGSPGAVAPYYRRSGGSSFNSTLLENELEMFTKDCLDSAEAVKELNKLKKEKQQLESRCSKLQRQASEAQSLRDELDTLRPVAAQKRQAEDQIKRLKGKVQEMETLKSNIEKLEKRNNELVDKNLRLEEEAQKIPSLEQSLDSAKDAKCSADMKISDLEEQNAELSANLEKSNNELLQLKRQLEASESQAGCQSVNNDMDEFHVSKSIASGIPELNHEFSETLQRLKKDNERLQNLLEEQSNESVRKLRDDLDSESRMKQEFEKRSREFQAQCKSLQKELEETQASLATEKDLHAHMKAKLSELQSSYEDLQRQLLKEQESYSAFAEDFQKRMEALNQDIEKLESEKCNLQEECEALESKLQSQTTEYEQKLKTLQDDKQIALNSIEEYKQKYSIDNEEYQRRTEEYQNEIDTLREQVDQMNFALSDSSSKLDSKEKELLVKDGEISDLRSQVFKYKTQYEKANSDNTKLRRELEGGNTVNGDTLRSQLAESVRNYEELKKENTKLKEKVDTLRSHSGVSTRNRRKAESSVDEVECKDVAYNTAALDNLQRRLENERQCKQDYAHKCSVAVMNQDNAVRELHKMKEMFEQEKREAQHTQLELERLKRHIERNGLEIPQGVSRTSKEQQKIKDVSGERDSEDSFAHETSISADIPADENNRSFGDHDSATKDCGVYQHNGDSQDDDEFTTSAALLRQSKKPALQESDPNKDTFQKSRRPTVVRRRSVYSQRKPKYRDQKNKENSTRLRT